MEKSARQNFPLACRMTEAALSLTQVDPSVLSELPQELQDELTALLPARSKHSKHAQQPRTAADLQHPAAARLNLLKVGRNMTNRAIRLEQERLAASAAERAGSPSEEAIPAEPASELWAELETALSALSRQFDSVSSEEIDKGSDEHENALTGAHDKLEALSQLVVQWAVRQAAFNLEDVQYMVRRLAGFKSADSVKKMIVQTLPTVQNEVKCRYGAKLRLSSSLL